MSSTLVPVSGICGFCIKQRGHGHLDRYFIHARSILYESNQWSLHIIELDSLFGVVRCICENPQEDSAPHSITASDEYSVYICFHKGFVEN